MVSKKKQIKYKRIPENIREEIFQKFILDEANRSQLSQEYDIPYSTLRRFLHDELKNRDLEGSFRIQYLNVEHFPFLAESYTFQFDEAFTIWKVIGKTRKESDNVFVLVPSKSKGTKHYVNDEEVCH